jgi:hypothetical protein
LQINCSIYARTGQQEATNHQKYPDLQKRIEQEHQAKIDSIVLLNKYGGVDSRASASFRAGSFHGFDEIPKPTSSRRRSSSHMPTSPSPSATPVLKGKSSMADLMFEMDEDDEDAEAPLSSFKQKLAAATAPPDLSSPAATNLWANRKTSKPITGAPEPIAASPKNPGPPWGVAPLPSGKIDMREIMQQASGGQLSNLSLDLAAAASSVPKTTAVGSFTGKISQKERKRQQQVQHGTKSDSTVAPATASPAQVPSSPWQMADAKSKSISRTVSGNTPSAQPILSGPQAPHMTMRQTVAKQCTPVNEKSPWTGQVISSPPSTKIPSAAHTPRPASSRAASTPKKPSDIMSGNSPGFAVSDRPVAVQSVRHVPKPDKNMSTDQRNMIDILSEQEIQKQEIRDFGSKRSLQEIQQEQEFQEWWDKESARVREAEAAAKNRAKVGKGGRRRGRGGSNTGAAEPGGERKKMGNRGRGGGKDGPSSSKDSVAASVSNAATKQ